jgi:hypothetical protein
MLIAVASLKGSPGVTTFALALAARWPAPPTEARPAARCVVVEADPSGGDIATRFDLASSPGLVSLAAAARRDADAGLLWRHTQALPGGLPVITAPPGADQARAALGALGPDTPTSAGVVQRAADRPGAVVIADCGRLDPDTPAVPVVRGADVLLVVTGARAGDLAHLAARLPGVGRWSRMRALLLVGEGYPAVEVSRELGVPVLARIPSDPRGAALLRGRPGVRRTPARSALGRSAGQIAGWVITHRPTPPATRPPPARTGTAPHPPQSTVDELSQAGPGFTHGATVRTLAPPQHPWPDHGAHQGGG